MPPPTPAVVQHFAYVRFEARGEHIRARALPVRVPFQLRDVVAVWTILYATDERVPPPRPFTPRHGYNAFLEDYLHDWTMQGHNFLYRGRLTDRGVWVLIETRAH